MRNFGLCICVCLIVNLLSLSVFAQNNANLQNNNEIWIALEVGNEIMTSYEVTDYIDSVVIAADIHAQIFTEVNKDYNEYLVKKQTLIDELYPRVLRQLSSIRLIQAEATKNEDRGFFRLTKAEFKKSYDEKVTKVLSRYSTASGRLEDAQNAFVDDLIKNGYPTYLGQNPQDIFQEWSRQLKMRIKEEYRWKEATRYLCAMGDCATLGENVVFQKSRKYFEKSHHLVFRPNVNERWVGTQAFDLLFKEELMPQEDQKNENTDNELKKEFYLGKFIDDRVEIIHLNDWNLLGPIGTKLGYPDTDDMGRTAGTLIRYIQNREKGSWSVEFENWLFTENVGEENGETRQHVEDETTLRIVSRHFLDGQGDKWILIGVSATNRIQEAGLGAWLQENFHKLNSKSSERINVPRDEVDNYIQGLIGIGGKYSIIDTAHVDLIIRGEIVLAPTVGKWSENYVQVSSGIDLNVYGKNKRLPILQIGLFGDIKLRADGEVETTIGGKATIGILIKRLYIQTGLFVARFDGVQDRRYEGGASWTTGILITVSIQPKRRVPDYLFSPLKV